MPITLSGDGVISGLTATGISAVQNLPATGSMTTLGVSGDLSFNSGFGSAGIAYGCRAWVNFNGTGTVAIRASGNVSSITDNGTGDYTVNFTTAMPDANYVQVINAGLFSASGDFTYTTTTGTQTTTSCRPQVSAYNVGTARIDTPNVCIAVFR